jgi:hypothetical protein
MPDQTAPKSAPTYAALTDTFKTQKEPRGFSYITGEQCISRLNEVLGYDGWSFRIKEHGIDAESDTVWVLGELIIYSENGIHFRTHAGEGTMVGVLTREQFGSQQHNRRRDNHKILDYGFDLKGAATDALKKCATLVGVGLYLSSKETAGPIPNQGGTQDRSPDPQPTQTKASSSPASARQASSNGSMGEPGVDDSDDGSSNLLGQDDICSECGAVIASVKRQDGSTMSAQAFAERTRTEFGFPLCAKHYKAKLAEGEPKTSADPKAPQKAAESQETASVRDAATGKLHVTRLMEAYGEFVAGQLRKGYKEPSSKAKQSFYATLSTATGYNRDTVHALLGLSVDKEAHIDEWLAAADTQIGHLLNILIRHHQQPDDIRIPTLADLS